MPISKTNGDINQPLPLKKQEERKGIAALDFWNIKLLKVNDRFQREMMGFKQLRARLVCVFKNWKLLFKNICGNTCRWKSVLKCVKCCLKIKNCCLKTQTKHPLKSLTKYNFHSISGLVFHPVLRLRLCMHLKCVSDTDYFCVGKKLKTNIAQASLLQSWLSPWYNAARELRHS